MIEYMNIEELQSLSFDTLSYQNWCELRNNEYVGCTYYNGLGSYSFDIIDSDGNLIDNIEVFVEDIF